MRRWTATFIMLALAAAVAAAVAAFATAQDRDYAGTRQAPEFPGDLDWINTGGERLTLAGLRGKVVLLDFWTYGCINCMHIIPDLKRLKRDHGDALVVVGVHSAKFEHEGRTSSIRRIAQRYERDEPIVNDHEMTIWRSYGVRAWPTLALIDPAGNVLGIVEGEGHYELLDEVIGGMIAQFDAAGALDRSPPAFAQALEMPDTPLRFPGKVLADGARGRLFIADSNHDRIVVTDLDGQVVDVIGGERGFRDGAFEDAAFKGPQGLALGDDGALYVADTLNNAIRRVDLAGRTVETVAGNGERRYLHDAVYPARGTGLNSPWDVLWHDGVLYIAMAGQHQLWAWHPGEDTVRAFAGTRREELRDGARFIAGFNQPSGLAVHDGRLMVADSEASAVRAVGFGDDDSVTTLVGTGLFDFGDRDGTGDAVRLQHPLGVAVHGEHVYIADTYNGKVKRLDPATRRVDTFVDAGLDEPGGITVAAGELYVADTNNHRVVVVDIETGEARLLELVWDQRSIE